MKTDHHKLLDRLLKLESQITPHGYARAGRAWFRTITGTGSVLLSAPHACRHIREGVEKMGEEFTASLAAHVALTTGNHAIFTTHQSLEDPNWVPGGEYKARVRQLVAEHDIKLVIDLHGMVNRHHMGLALGTIDGRALQGREVVSPFIRQGFRQVRADELAEPLAVTPGVPQPAGSGAERCWQTLVVDHPRFTGGVRNHTVTRFVSETLGVAGVQVEIASVNRIVHRPPSADWPYEYRGNPKGISATVEALTQLADAI